MGYAGVDGWLCGDGWEIIVNVVLAYGSIGLSVEGLIGDESFVEVDPVF